MRPRIAAIGLFAALSMASMAEAGPLAQNVLRNLGWWYGPGYSAFNACPGYPNHCWAYMPTTFPAPVPWGVALPHRGACADCGPYGYGPAYGPTYGTPEIFHYPASPYQLAPGGGVEVIEEPTPEGATPPADDGVAP